MTPSLKNPAPSCGWSGGGLTSANEPAILASPGQSLGPSLGGSKVGLWSATRASRHTSRSFIYPGTMSVVASPSELNSNSEALIRGEPSGRKVAKVLLVSASKVRRTWPANSGASCLISCQEVNAQLLHPRDRRVPIVMQQARLTVGPVALTLTPLLII